MSAETQTVINPHMSQGAEQSVLGSILIDNSVTSTVLARAPRAHFYGLPHKQIRDAIQSLFDAGQPIDLITLEEELDRLDALESVGGFAYLADLAKNTPTSANVGAYLNILDDKFERREAAKLARLYDLGDITFAELNDSLSRLSRAREHDLFELSVGSDGYDKQMDFIIDEVIPAESFGVIFGPSESLKSFIALEQAFCIAQGIPWDGHATEPGLVIYEAAEGQTGMSRRIKALEIKYNTKADNLYVLGRAVTMNDKSEVDRLIRTISQVEDQRGQKARLLVIDTLARSIEGDENTAKDMGSFIRGCDIIRNELHLAVIAIHHSGKDADKGARGSSALRAACDFEYSITRDQYNAILKCTKIKDGRKIEPKMFTMTEVELGFTNKFGRMQTTLVTDGDSQPAPEQKKPKSNTVQDEVFDLVHVRMIQNNATKVESSVVRDDYINKHLDTGLDKEATDKERDRLRKKFKRAIDSLVKLPENDPRKLVIDGTFLRGKI